MILITTTRVRINIIKRKGVLRFITPHAAALHETMEQKEISDKMRQHLEKSNYLFSYFKTFSSLLDKSSNKKLFEHFWNNVQRVHKTYKEHYLHKVTLRLSSPFWDQHFPPNGWNCRCTMVQVRKGKYKEAYLYEAEQKATKAKDNRFNVGKERKSIPDYNPYTILKCSICPVVKGKEKMALAKIPDNELCQACKIVRTIKLYKAKETQKQARKELQGKTILIDNFPYEILISRMSIKEWVNQPYKFPNKKYEMLFNIEEVLRTSKYMGWVEDHKNKDGFGSYIFKVDVIEEEHAIIVKRITLTEVALYSISDNPAKIFANLHTEEEMPTKYKNR